MRRVLVDMLMLAFVMATVFLFISGAVRFRNTDEEASIAIEKKKIRETAKDVVDRGREFKDFVVEGLSGENDQEKDLEKGQEKGQEKDLDKQAPDVVHHGKVVNVSATRLMIAEVQTGKDVSFDVPDDALVVRDGRPVALVQLQRGDAAKVVTRAFGPQFMVKAVEAVSTTP